MITEVMTEIGVDLGFYDHFAGAGILRDYWDPDLLRRVNAEFSHLDSQWDDVDTSNEVIYLGYKYSMWGPALRELLTQMCDRDFVRVLEEFSGVQKLIPEIDDGGYRQIDKGGFQRLHVQADPHPVGWHRMYVEVFLSEGLEAGNGGEFMVYNNPEPFSDGKALPSLQTQGLCTAPLFNHTVVVKTTPTTFYGSPNPLLSETPRRSVVVYYYTEEPPDDYTSPHQRIWWGA